MSSSTQRLNRGVGLRSVRLLEHLESPWVDVGSSHQVDMRHGHHGWCDAGSRQTQTYHAHVQGARLRCHGFMSHLLLRPLPDQRLCLCSSSTMSFQVAMTASILSASRL